MGARCSCGISAGDVLQSYSKRTAARSQGWSPVAFSSLPRKKTEVVSAFAHAESQPIFLPLIYETMEQELDIRWISLVSEPDVS